MGKPGIGNQGRSEICEISEMLHNAVFDVVQTGVGKAVKALNASIGDAAYMACSASLAAAKVACFTFGKKPQVTQEEVDKRGDELMYSLISPESIMFSCLTSALMLTDYNPKTGENTIEFGPPIFWEALQMWQKLNPEKDPDKYLDRSMLKAARLAGEDSVIPFEEFLSKRAKAHPSPSTLQ